MRAKTLLVILAIYFFATGCTGSNPKNNAVKPPSDSLTTKSSADTTKASDQVKSTTDLDPAKVWLERIFHCNDDKSGKYCYYLDKEEALCTARFMEFLADANEIYGPSNLTDAELPEAEARYKAKWGKIYPLYTQEMWLFGRGNDDALAINTVEIKKLSTDKYSVFIDYGNNIKTQNEVQLVLENSNYKIDYCKTSFVQ
ncbi:hypothetical protein [Sphingobacterium sp. GVS05A]|uniref:hypothetical protein n=1 Tax=Sphingobacterium TaxID=28453 RepID=UPI001CBE76BB|nr:hypothetical protein [Sphingobacterium sp. GVS05A]